MPASKMSSHHSTVTRTTRVIFVQEISDTFEAESCETSSFESPTAETGASTACHGIPRSTMSDPPHPEESFRESLKGRDLEAAAGSDQPRSRKAESNCERGEPCSVVLEDGGASMNPVCKYPDDPCALKAGSLHQNNDDGLILTARPLLAEAEDLQNPARFLQDGLIVIQAKPPPSLQGKNKSFPTDGVATFGSKPLPQDGDEFVSYPQDLAIDILNKSSFLQHGSTVFSSSTLLQEGSAIIGPVPSFKDGNNTVLPSTQTNKAGDTTTATPPVQDDKVVLQVEAKPVHQEPDSKPVDLRSGKNRIHPFEFPADVRKPFERGIKKPITHGPNPAERSTRAPKALQQHSNDLRTLTDSLTYAKFYPVMVSMKATGLFFVPRKVVQGGCIPLSLLRNVTCQQAYCLCVTFALFVNFLRSLFAFGGDNNTTNILFFKLMVSIFFYEAFSRATLAYMSCRKDKKGLPKLFLDIDRICFADGIIPYENSLRFWIRFFLVLSIVLSGANVFMTAYGMFGPADIQDLFDVYLVPMGKDSPGAVAFKVIFLLMTALNSAVATMSLTFHAITCYLLYKEFEYMCRTLTLKINADGQLTDDLEKFRMKHQKR